MPSIRDFIGVPGLEPIGGGSAPDLGGGGLVEPPTDGAIDYPDIGGGDIVDVPDDRSPLGFGRFLKNKEGIIGLKNPSLKVTAVDAVGGSQVTMTQTTFDTATRGDSAQILLTNGTGATAWLTGVSIRGTIVYIQNGDRGGWTHDKFVDVDDIRRNGERKFTLDNNYIVEIDQVNKLADYYWKFFRGTKHYYTVSLTGTWAWFEPGEWYTLTLGGAGQEENINATVELIRVRSGLNSKRLGTSTLLFREVEANWTPDSNAAARFFASGKALAKGRDIVSVGNSAYVGQVDYYCDGTADEVQIQAAIDYVKGNFNGGSVLLARGTYTVSSAIQMRSNVTLRGEGRGTIINLAAGASADNVVAAIGTEGSELTGVEVRDMTLSSSAASGFLDAPIIFWFTDRSIAADLVINGACGRGMEFNACNNLVVERCLVIDAGLTDHPGNGITINQDNGVFCTGRLTGCEVYNTSERTYDLTGNSVAGISFVTNEDFVVESCWVHDLVANPPLNAGVGWRGFLMIGDKGLLRDCRASGLRMLATTNQLIAFEIDGNDNRIQNCVAEDNYSLSATPANGRQFRVTVAGGTSDRNVFQGCIAFQNGRGFAAGGTGTVYESCIAENNGNRILDGACEAAVPKTFGEVTNATVNATIAQSTAQADTGVESALVTKSSTGIGRAYFVDSTSASDIHGANLGYTWILEGRCYVPASTDIGPTNSTEASIFLEHSTGSTSWSATYARPTTARDSWQTVSVEHALPLTAAGFRYGAELNAAATTGESVYWDNVILYPKGRRNDHLYNFQDGGTNTRF